MTLSAAEKLLDLVGNSPRTDSARQAVWHLPAGTVHVDATATVGAVNDAAWRHVAEHAVAQLVAGFDREHRRRMTGDHLVGVVVPGWSLDHRQLVVPWPHRTAPCGRRLSLVAVGDTAVAQLFCEDLRHRTGGNANGPVLEPAPQGYTLERATRDVATCAQLLTGNSELANERVWAATWLLEPEPH